MSVRIVRAMLVIVVVAIPLVALAQSGPLFPGDKSIFPIDGSGDVTIQDYSGMKPGQSEDKIWKFYNAGTVEWKDRQLMLTANEKNEMPLNVPKFAKLPDTKPGKECRPKVRVTVPKDAKPGENRAAYYKQVIKRGKDWVLCFPDKKAIYVVVKVQ